MRPGPKAGGKENRMTLSPACERAVAKRHAEACASQGDLHSLVAAKKMRVLEPLKAQRHAPQAPAAARAGGGGTPAEANNLPLRQRSPTPGCCAGHQQQQQPASASKAARKRSRQEQQPGGSAAAAAAAAGSGASPARGADPAAPAAGGGGCAAASMASKRGKRADGGSSAALSPRAAAAAVEAQQTCEGLERDPDLELEAAFIASRAQRRRQHQEEAAAAATLEQQAPAQRLGQQQQQQPPGGGSGSGAGSRGERGARVSGGEPSDPCDARKDADKCSSRGRDQGQHGSRGRDQQPPGRSRAAAVEAAGGALRSPTAWGPEEDEAHVSLDLVPDRDWARLFAVLSISSGASPCAKAAAAADPQQQRQQQQQQQQPAAQEAPATPTRREGAGAEGATPTRRSFLATEFSRVQAMRTTPER